MKSCSDCQSKSSFGASPINATGHCFTASEGGRQTHSSVCERHSTALLCFCSVSSLPADAVTGNDHHRRAGSGSSIISLFSAMQLPCITLPNLFCFLILFYHPATFCLFLLTLKLSDTNYKTLFALQRKKQKTFLWPQSCRRLNNKKGTNELKTVVLK